MAKSVERYYFMEFQGTGVKDDENHILRNAIALASECEIKANILIEPELLKRYGASRVQLRKDEAVFHEGGKASNYFQLEEGSIKMVTYSTEGQEFIQGIFNPGESFGEPPLFCDFVYPSTAISLSPSSVWRIPKDRFYDLLKENFEVHLKLDQVLCERLRYKNMILSEISFYEPEHRIMSLITYLRSKLKSRINQPGKFQVPLTRQQIADMSGMRVETVIRTVKRMEEEGKLRIVGHKIEV